MKEVFLIRWFSDDSVWKVFSSEEEAREFAYYVNEHSSSDKLEVYVDSVTLD